MTRVPQPVDAAGKCRPGSTHVLVMVLAAAATGCAGTPPLTDPPAGFGHAYASPSCAPWDGYAVSLVLRGAALAPGDSAIEAGDAPQLRLAIYPRRVTGAGPSGVRPGTYRWPDEPEVAAGAWCENGRCTAMPGGRITVREAGDDGRLAGTMDVRLHDGRTLRGAFDAEWRPRKASCI